MITVGYAATRAEGLQMLAEYNNNPFDTKAAKMTFSDVYEEWSKRKYPTVSESNVKGYTASYKACGTLYNKVFKDIRLVDLQNVIDTCGKNYPTLRENQSAFQSALRLRLEKRYLQQRLFQFCGCSTVQKTATRISMTETNLKRMKLRESGNRKMISIIRLF